MIYFIPYRLTGKSIDGIKWRTARVRACNARHAELCVMLRKRPLEVEVSPVAVVMVR